MVKSTWKVFAGLAIMALILAACAAPTAAPAVPVAPVAGDTAAPQVVTATGAPTKNPYDEKAPITVWIDTDRQPMVDAYKKAFPDKASLIKTVTVDREQLPAKVLLFNNTNQGWPDVVFAEPRLVGRVADSAHHFPMDLTPWVKADVLSAYSGMDACTFDGKVMCVRNDLAMYVLYYNKPLMDQFGYTVPTTFEEYQDLSDKVAKDHPGYLMGVAGDGWAILHFMDASGCQIRALPGNSVFKMDVTDPKCIRAAKLMDHMLGNGTLSPTDYWDAGFTKKVADNKLLVNPGPAWMFGVYGGNKDSSWYKTADHQLGVATPLKWAADDKARTATMGGAAWTVSSHTKNPKLAADLVVWLTTDPKLWSTTTNYPAYKPLGAGWQKTVSANALFANDPFPIYSAAADMIGPADTWPRFDLIAPLNEIVKGALQNKKSIESSLPLIVDKLSPLAEAQGYTVDAKK